MTRWLHIAVLAMVCLGFALTPASADAVIGGGHPASHGHTDGDCNDLHADHGAGESDHAIHCCLAGATGAFIQPATVAVSLPLESGRHFQMPDSPIVAGPLYGIFRPPRNA